ncbi:MAG TPA: hypothetical protein ENI08_00915 [Candidatus Dependentiae bacterium]|nr:hypothetical protein [Candidatus Dependentiae bacterium]
MNKEMLKKTLYSNAPLKAIALILGYSFWYILSHGHTTAIWLDVPLSFYAIPPHLILHAPDTVAINLAGKRTDLYNLDKNQLAVHVDAHELFPGYNNLSITAETLFLPDTIKLVHYKPSNILIEVQEKTEVQEEIINTTTDY